MKRTLKRFIVSLLSLVFGISCLLAKTWAQAVPNQKLSLLKIGLEDPISPIYAGFYVADALHEFQKRQIQVDLEETLPKRVLTELMAGHYPLVFTSLDQLLITRAQGYDVIGIMVLTSTSDIALAVRSGITRPRDLMGKRVAVRGNIFEQKVIATMVENDMGDASAVDFQFVSAYASPDFTKLDAILLHKGWAFPDEDVSNGAWHWLDPQNNLDFALPGPVLVVRSSWLSAHSDEVIKFLAALTEGYKWAADQPNVAIDYYLAKNPNLDRSQVWRSLLYYQPLFFQPSFGKINGSEWQEIGIWMKLHGLLPNELVVGDAYSNRFLGGP